MGTSNDHPCPACFSRSLRSLIHLRPFKEHRAGGDVGLQLQLGEEQRGPEAHAFASHAACKCARARGSCCKYARAGADAIAT
eukprot:14329882-Alexandrium_andersonii.AAC.1